MAQSPQPEGRAAQDDPDENPLDSSPDATSLAQVSEPSECSFGDLEWIDIFGFEPRDGDELLPVVRVWLDIAGHFSDKDIPSPRGFVEESEAILCDSCIEGAPSSEYEKEARRSNPPLQMGR
ncbi:hypothetical protein BV20DRAFT_1056702 [Pilatotrama ljubarskyi]|nr:hypothetical protein BV20DRAFT_1056702 [Pilatotrama ljubarskyi]